MSIEMRSFRGGTLGTTYPEVKRRKRLTPAEFEREYLVPGRPVVIEDAASDWARKWTFESIRERFGKRRVWATEEYLDRPQPVDREVTVEEIVDTILQGSLKYRFRNFLQELPELAEMHAADPFHRRVLGRDSSAQHIFWLTPAGNQSTFHHDNCFDNINLQIVGAKHWLLVSPSQYRCLSPVYFHRSPIDPFAPNLDDFPKFSQAVPLQVTLREGEVIYVPRLWWHCVRSLEPSINMNTFVHNGGTLKTWKDAVELPLVPRLALSYAAHKPALGFTKTERGLHTALHWLVKKALWRDGATRAEK